MTRNLPNKGKIFDLTSSTFIIADDQRLCLRLSSFFLRKLPCIFHKLKSIKNKNQQKKKQINEKHKSFIITL
ncbi:hypothetical protein HanHA300_Chr08g0269011 [Helianthus annuus]|nr:hypothetical protein HanHA300_Chr08g0269011 [Helianthus annuus]